MEAAGTFGTSAITAITAQHTRGVESTHVVPVEEVRAQIRAVCSDFDVSAAKTGMLATAPIVDLVREEFAQRSIPLVVDPVMVAASGDRLLDEDAESAYEPLIGTATLVTPNAAEAEVLTDRPIESAEEAKRAGEDLVDVGANGALVKGGHLDGETVTDVLVTETETIELEHPRVETRATHGSGCTLASTIAARLAHGDPMVEAVEQGIATIQRAVRYPIDVGHGPGSVQHLATLRNEADKPSVLNAVRTVVATLEDADVSNLIPEVGMNIVGATPMAESRSDTGAVEGRLTRTGHGVRATGGISIGASSHVARFLLAAREHEPTLRFCVNCRYDADVDDAVTALDWPQASYDRAEQPDHVRNAEGATMGWAASTAFSTANTSPRVVFDPGAHGKEPMTKILARDAATLEDRLLALSSELENG